MMDPAYRTVVFLKGCSLECRWCSNPECISGNSEVGLFRNLCTSCGACAEVCPNGALAYTPGSPPNIDRSLCTGCGECVASCSYEALVLYGRRMTVDEVFDVVRRDAMFYDASGGGVTVSGGEPLLQPAFVGALLRRCRDAGIHTCVETSGCAPESAVRRVLPYADYWLYDLKLYDPARHSELHGPHERDHLGQRRHRRWERGGRALQDADHPGHHRRTVESREDRRSLAAAWRVRQK